MRLSMETHYALLALVYLAKQREGMIHRGGGVGARAGLVHGHRGRERGYGPARAADSLGVREVTETFEGDGYFQRCIFWSSECSEKDPCPLLGVWAGLRPHVCEAFSELTVAALAARPSRRRKSARSVKAPRRAARRPA